MTARKSDCGGRNEVCSRSKILGFKVERWIMGREEEMTEGNKIFLSKIRTKE